MKDNTKEKAALEKEVIRDDDLLAKVNIEIGIVEEKGQKVKVKRLKAEEKKKKIEKEARRKLRQKELMKSGKVIKKKSSGKKKRKR